MKTDHIEKIFKEYLETKNTQYAILLNGSWGCGKTFFWKNQLKKIAEEKKLETIYISLNGLSKIDDLERQLFLRICPIIGKQESKAVKNIISIVTNAINIVGKKFVSANLSDVFKGLSVDMFDFSKYVICFDDLERAQIPVKEVLGFINNYVEHKSLKTIILADEKNIDSRQVGYDNIKEKVIGRILNFELDIKATLPEIFKRFESINKPFFDFLTTHSTLITDLCIEYKQDNLRIISFYLEILEKVSSFLKDKEAKYTIEVIISTLIFSIEFKKGNIKSADNSNYKDFEKLEEFVFSIAVMRNLKSQKEEVTEESMSYAEKTYNKYLIDRIKQFFFYPSVYKYILTGYFDSENFNAELNKRKPIIESEEISSFKTLLNPKFRELTDDVFQILAPNVLEYAKQGKYSIYQYAALASYYYFFSDKKLISTSKENITTAIEEGLNIAKTKKEIDGYSLENLLHFKNDNQEVEKVKQAITEIHEEVAKEITIKETSVLLDSLVNESELSYFFETYKFSPDLFKYITDVPLLDATINTTNKQLSKFTELLRKRYTSSNIGEFLFEDSIILSKLKDDLKEYLSKGTVSNLRMFLFESLIECLDAICSNLYATKKITDEELDDVQ